MYSKANHGFHNDTTPRYDEAQRSLPGSRPWICLELDPAHSPAEQKPQTRRGRGRQSKEDSASHATSWAGVGRPPRRPARPRPVDDGAARGSGR